MRLRLIAALCVGGAMSITQLTSGADISRQAITKHLGVLAAAGLVRDHLKEVIASRAFAGSKRAQDFLQLIVEHALAGRFDSLRERMIGAEMFGRPIDYDTANDAVVRVKATEVRRKLAQYYQESGKKPAVRIELPIGSYVPKFQWESLETSAQPSAETDLPAFAEETTAQEKSGERPKAEINEPPSLSGEKSRRASRSVQVALVVSFAM